MNTSLQHLLRIGMLFLLAILCPAVAIGQEPAVENPGMREIKVGMAIVVAADGSVASVVPDAATPEPLKAALVKRVTQWRYSIPKWQGHAVSLGIRQGLQLQLWPTTTGGYAIRIKDLSYVLDPDPRYGMPHFDYPDRLNRHGIEGEFRYAMRIETDGRIVDVSRIYPEGSLHSGEKVLDTAARRSLEGWTHTPIIVDGTAITCSVSFGVNFVSGSSSPDHASQAKANRDATSCPVAGLQTKIEGSLL